MGILSTGFSSSSSPSQNVALTGVLTPCISTSRNLLGRTFNGGFLVLVVLLLLLLLLLL
jgi:hypothetical protein